MSSIKNFRTLTMVSAIVMAIVGLGAAAMPLKAQNQPLLCMFYFPGCTPVACQVDYCDVYEPGSTGFCQGQDAVCCNCYY
ncbi:MAG: hypothetical protein AAB224_02450 [Gemmatimonadota bacterium]